MVAAYAGIVGRHGGRMDGWWEYGMSIADASGNSVEDSIISPRIFVAEPSKTVVPEYPLESIQIDPQTGQYVSEMSPEEQAAFWQRTIGQPLSQFIRTNM
jgi:hypothetical protein